MLTKITENRIPRGRRRRCRLAGISEWNRHHPCLGRRRGSCQRFRSERRGRRRPRQRRFLPVQLGRHQACVGCGLRPWAAGPVHVLLEVLRRHALYPLRRQARRQRTGAPSTVSASGLARGVPYCLVIAEQVGDSVSMASRGSSLRPQPHSVTNVRPGAPPGQCPVRANFWGTTVDRYFVAGGSGVYSSTSMVRPDTCLQVLPDHGQLLVLKSAVG